MLYLVKNSNQEVTIFHKELIAYTRNNFLDQFFITDFSSQVIQKKNNAEKEENFFLKNQFESFENEGFILEQNSSLETMRSPTLSIEENSSDKSLNSIEKNFFNSLKEKESFQEKIILSSNNLQDLQKIQEIQAHIRPDILSENKKTVSLENLKENLDALSNEAVFYLEVQKNEDEPLKISKNISEEIIDSELKEQEELDIKKKREAIPFYRFENLSYTEIKRKENPTQFFLLN